MHLVAQCLFIEHGIEGRGTFLRLALLLERRPKFPDARTVPRSGSAHQFLRCETGRWGRPRAAPKPGHTRSGEHGRTSSPESGTSTSSCGNQTRCSPHRGWIPYGTTDQGKRPLSIGPSTSRGRRQRRDDYEHPGSRSVDIVYDVDGPRPTAHGRSPLFMIGQPKDASGFRILPETAEFGRPPRLAARAFHASGIRLRSPGSVLPPHTITATRSRAAGR